MSTSQGTTRLPYRGKAKGADVQTAKFDSSTLIVIRLKTASPHEWYIETSQPKRYSIFRKMNKSFFVIQILKSKLFFVYIPETTRE